MNKKAQLRLVGESTTKPRRQPKRERSKEFEEEQKRRRARLKKKKKKPEKEEKKEDVIRLGGEREEKEPETILEKTKDIPVVGTGLKVLASPKTTVVLAATLAAVSGAAFLKGAIAKSAASSGSLIGKHIDVDLIGRQLGLTAKQTAALAKEVGRRRISQIANTITNPKSASLMTNVLKKTFSGKTMALLGTAAGTIFLGKWGQAEAGEPISIIMKDVLRDAQKTGDYTLYDEAKAARDELTNLSAWESILSNTPFISPFIGIPNKIKGVQQAGAIMDELARQQQIQQETGESEEEKWARIDQEREERRERERIEDEQYYAQVQEDLAAAKKAARKDEEKYWRGVLADREAAEKAKREAEEKYWADVRRANSELKQEENKAFEEYAGSNLNFGLL